jgi:hypothetical protein
MAEAKLFIAQRGVQAVLSDIWFDFFTKNYLMFFFWE